MTPSGSSFSHFADRLFSVEKAGPLVGARADFDPGDILQANDAAVGVVSDDDVAELFGSGQPPLDVEFVVDVPVGVFGTDGTGGGLKVLRFHGGGDVGGGDAEAGHPQRVQPDAHRVLLRGHHFGGGDTVDPADRILDVGVDVVVELHQVHLLAVGEKGEHGENVAAAFLHADAVFCHIRRQLHFGALDSVLQVDQRDVGVGAALEGHLTGVAAGVVAGGGEVEQIVDAVDLVLDRHGDGLGDDLGAGAGIAGGDVERRGRYFRILRHREFAERDDAGQHHDQADDDCQARPFDEDCGKHELISPCRIPVPPSCRAAPCEFPW